MGRPSRRLCRLVCVALAFSLAMSAVGALASNVPTTIRVAMVTAPDMPMHPLRIRDRDAVSILGLVYESLVELDDRQMPSPKLATWENPGGDGQTWIFTIKENVYFHDGRPLTAYDVAATMDYIAAIAADETLETSQKGLYYLLPSYCSSWTAEDSRTLRVRTKRQGYGFLYAMVFPVLQAQFLTIESPPGTGPYRIDYYVPGAELSIVGNSNWREKPPYVSEIVAKWYANGDDAMRAFESEQVDILMTRSISAVRYRGTLSSRINSYDYSTRQLECLLFNLINKKKGLNELTFREAICYAIDKTRLIQNVYQNIVTETDTLLPLDSWLYNDTKEVRTFGYDPNEANKRLDELGWTLRDDQNYRIKKTENGDQQLSLRIGYYEEAGSSLRQDAASEIASMLNAVGIRVSVEGMKFDRAQQKLGVQDYDLFLCAYNFDILPDPSFLLTSSDVNYTRYSDKEMTALCDELKKAATQEAFSQAWAAIQVKMSFDLPLLPLYFRNGVMLTRYPFSSVRDIREFELLRSMEHYMR